VKPQKKKKKKKKKEKQSLGLKKTAVNPKVVSHSCAECWENYYTTRRKDDWI
jgi:hypothetical protein